MARYARISDDVRAQIRADFKAGASKNSLALKYDKPVSTIFKICKDQDQDNAPLVKKQVQIEQIQEQITQEQNAINAELSSQSEKEVKAFRNAVDEKIRRANFILGKQERAIARMCELLEQSDSITDHAIAIKAIDTASLTLGVNERHAPRAEIKAQASAQSNVITIKRGDI